MRTLALVLIASLSLTGVAVQSTPAFAQAVPDCGLPNFPPCPTPKDLPEAQVCFYIDTDFSDRHWCESGTRTVNKIKESWKHHVKSIQFGKNSSVRICSEPDMKGTCELLDSDVRELTPDLFDHLYSYRTMKVRY